MCCFCRILVGAPRARGLGHLRRTHTGALYRCPITAEEFDCERVDIDGDGQINSIATHTYTQKTHLHTQLHILHIKVNFNTQADIYTQQCLFDVAVMNRMKAIYK